MFPTKVVKNRNIDGCDDDRIYGRVGQVLDDCLGGVEGQHRGGGGGGAHHHKVTILQIWL